MRSEHWVAVGFAVAGIALLSVGLTRDSAHVWYIGTGGMFLFTSLRWALRASRGPPA
ncbi:MAG: hypothetical protein ABIV10_02265 [Gemmatimonadaceae bacterium]